MGGDINNVLMQKDSVNLLYIDVQLDFKNGPCYRCNLQVTWEAVAAWGAGQSYIHCSPKVTVQSLPASHPPS